MNNNNILASIALFSKLYDNNKNNIILVISEFIKVVVYEKELYSFNTIDIGRYLKEIFNIEIPDAVIKSVIKKKLKLVFSKNDRTGEYITNPKTILTNTNFQNAHNELVSYYELVFQKLINFYETSYSTSLSETDKSELKSDFTRFMLDKTAVNDERQEIFTTYILTNQSDDFKEKLNLFEEGLILYSGVQYSNDLNDLGYWNEPLTIYLDTEHLFNFEGYNGELHQQIFMDFYNLINEINRKSKKGKLIHLKYFYETQKEVEDFFSNTERYYNRQSLLDPSKDAMINILKGVKSPSDILEKKSLLFSNLQSCGIQLEENDISLGIWNITSDDLITELKKQFRRIKHRRWVFEDDIILYLDLFSRINTLRKGENCTGFDKCKYIVMSENGLAHFIANFEEIRENKSVPYATNIEFITARLWFKLQKGFSKTSNPISFDIIARCQMVLSSLIADNVADKYNELKNANLDEAKCQSIYNDLRILHKTPETINSDDVPQIKKLLHYKSIEDLLREKSLEKDKTEKLINEKDSEISKLQDNVENLTRNNQSLQDNNVILTKQINNIERQLRKTNLHKLQIRLLRRFWLRYIIGWIIMSILVIIILCAICYLISDADTPITIIASCITIILPLWPIISSIKKSWLSLSKHKTKLIREYRKILMQ